MPGAAIGFLITGLSLPAMSLGGFVRWVRQSRSQQVAYTPAPRFLREDASLAAFYLVSLALGVLIVSVRGSNIDLLRVLFGTVLALDDAALMLVAGAQPRSHAGRAGGDYGQLVLECFDPQVPARGERLSSTAHFIFLVLVVLNLVG